MYLRNIFRYFVGRVIDGICSFLLKRNKMELSRFLLLEL